MQQSWSCVSNAVLSDRVSKGIEMSVVIAYSIDRGTTWTYYNEQVQIAINEIFTVASRGVDIAGRYGSWYTW